MSRPDETPMAERTRPDTPDPRAARTLRETQWGSILPGGENSTPPSEPPTLTNPVVRVVDIGPPVIPAIPGYEVVAEIARGGMGVVYRARQDGLNRPAAIKLILGGKYQDSSVLMRFFIEAETIAQLHHEHVVQVYEFGQHDGMPFLAMEYVGGGTLAQRLASTPPQTPRAAAELMVKLADAMAAAHAKGIVHRDLKPSNVLLTVGGEPKVSDFGLAKVGDSGVTASDAILGTPSHMSPEQAAGRTKDVGTASDVWALGCILYRLLTDRLPFDADTPAATIQLVLTHEPTRPRSIRSKVPRDLETICLKCLEKDLRNRYRTADALAADLRAYLEGRPIAARSVGPAERTWKWAKRHPGQSAALAAALLIGFAAGVAAFQVDRALARQREDAAKQQREARAHSLVRTMSLAEPAAVPSLIEEMAIDRELVRPKLLELAVQPVDERAGLYGRYALLDEQPRLIEELLSYVPRCRPDELPLFTRLRACPAPGLWQTVGTGSGSPQQVLRAAAILAAWEPDDPRWPAIAPALTEQLVRISPVEADAFARLLQPVRRALLPELMRRYPHSRRRLETERLTVPELVAESVAFDVTTNVLAQYTPDLPEPLAQLAISVDDRHYGLFTAAVEAKRAALVPFLVAELDGPADGGASALAAVAGGTVPPHDEVIERCLRRRGNAAALLFRFGEYDTVWPLLAQSDDHTARSHLIARMKVVGVDPSVLVKRYAGERDVATKRSILHALVALDPKLVSQTLRDDLADRLVVDYASHTDPGMHSAIHRLGRAGWGKFDALVAIDAEHTAAACRAALSSHAAPRALIGGLFDPLSVPAPPSSRKWFVNTQGQTFAVVSGPVVTQIGSPDSEPGREPPREVLFRTRLTHTFAIATREVTNEQFRWFRSSYVGDANYSPHSDCPAVKVTWYEAAEYCNWLSEREGIPRDQWCYQPNADGKYADGMTVRRDRLTLRGYRLPTEVEWECCTRAGGRAAQSFGRGGELLPYYAWFIKSSDHFAHPVGRLLPNDWGLFDAHGNVWEWCEDAAVLDDPNAVVKEYWRARDSIRRAIRGGSFVDDHSAVRVANRNTYHPGNGGVTIGFRPVRSLSTPDAVTGR